MWTITNFCLEPEVCYENYLLLVYERFYTLAEIDYTNDYHIK